MSSPTSDASPSAAPRAVFLSYASQDADAARCICQTLRAAGIEVWFDQNELVGGDAWDAKIRKQIADCALFVPLISAATQARREGYFRLEWRIAAQRTHMMSEQIAFLLPVVIDATRDAEADVPGEFKAVQWTRLPAGEGAEKFCERVKKLLGGEIAPASSRPSDPAGKMPALPQASRRVPAAAWIGATVVALALVIWFSPRPNHTIPTSPPVAAKSTPTAAPMPLTKAQQLVAQARALYEPWDFASADDFKLAEQLLKQATELEPLNSDTWAALAIEAMGQHFFGYERNDARDALLRTAADRAVKLAPESDFAKLALAFRYRRGPGTDADALQILQELAPRHPADKFLLRQLGGVLAANNRDDEALAVYVRVAALPGGDAIALIGQERILERHQRLDEADAALDRALALRPDYGLAHVLKIGLQFYQRGDLERTRRALRAVPTRVLTSDDRVAMASAFSWYVARDADKAGEALRYVSHDHIESVIITVPKGLLAGLVHRLAGRNEAAAIEWQQAVRVLDQRLAANPASAGDVGDRAALLAMLGERAAAEAGLRVYEQLTRATAGRANRNSWTIYAELGRADVVADFFARQLKSPGSAASYAAFFKFHPALDRFRDQPQFQALAIEADRVFADRAAKPAGPPSSGDDQAAAAGPSAPPAQSVAVLAFADQSPAHDSEYFSDGISDELINVLGKIPSLKVPARTSSYFFKGKSVPLADIARQLGVAYIIDGSVQRIGERVKITARLSKAADGFQVWNDSFTREAKDVFAVEEEIAGLIAKQLSLKFGVSSAASKAAVNPEAFELYVRARQAWNLRTSAGYDRAEDLLNRALKLEPNFARAHAALADVWVGRVNSNRGESEAGDQADSAEWTRIRAKIGQALTLDPDSAEAHSSLGFALFNGGKNSAAETELRQAVALNPNYASAHQWLGRVLINLALMDEALVHLSLATELDPLSPAIWAQYGYALSCAGRPAEELVAVDRALTLQPNFYAARRGKAFALVEAGRFTEAVAQANRLPSDHVKTAAVRIFVLARAGLKAEAEALLAEPRSNANNSAEKPRSLLALGRTDEALALMDPKWITGIALSDSLWSPLYDSVRNDPRWVKLMAAAGLTEAHARAQAWRVAHPPEKPVQK